MIALFKKHITLFSTSVLFIFLPLVYYSTSIVCAASNLHNQLHSLLSSNSPLKRAQAQP